MAFRVSIRFNQQSSKLGGWSENFWCDISDRSQAILQANKLRIDLDRCKGTQIWSPSYRISEVGVFRSSQVIIFPQAKAGSSELFNADYPTTKILLKFSATGGSTLQWFGGVIDDYIAQSGNYVPTSTSVADFNRFFGTLTSNQTNWSIRILDPTRPTYLVKAIDPATGIVTTNVNTFPADSKVRIKGVKGLLEANAVWRITVIDNTHFSLNGWVPTTTIMTKGDPTVRLQSYVFRKIQKCEPIRSTSHKVGKPADQLTGKAKTRTR